MEHLGMGKVGAVLAAAIALGNARRIEGLHHYLFTQESIKIVGSTWMKYIESGYFD
jgi:hypothetical protein